MDKNEDFGTLEGARIPRTVRIPIKFFVTSTRIPMTPTSIAFSVYAVTLTGAIKYAVGEETERGVAMRS